MAAPASPCGRRMTRQTDRQPSVQHQSRACQATRCTTVWSYPEAVEVKCRRQGVRVCSSLFIIVVAPKQTQKSNTWSHFCRERQKEQRLGASQWFHCSSRKHPQSGGGSCRDATKQSNTLRYKHTPPQQLKPKGAGAGAPRSGKRQRSLSNVMIDVNMSSFQRFAFYRESSQLVATLQRVKGPQGPCRWKNTPPPSLKKGTFELKRKKINKSQYLELKTGGFYFTELKMNSL